MSLPKRRTWYIFKAMKSFQYKAELDKGRKVTYEMHFKIDQIFFRQLCISDLKLC
jgi:hypothetical protein